MGAITVIGGSGFVGRYVLARLASEGLEATAPAHADFDIAHEESPQLAAKLDGATVVVNCAGLARDARVDNLDAVNHEGVERLAAACRLAGVRRLVHVSALGADPQHVSRFQRAKGLAERALEETEEVEIVIVRPSIVMGAGGASGDFFSALAALPLPLRLGSGTWRIQPLHVTELAALIARLAVMPDPPPLIDAVGPAPATTDETILLLRRWLGLQPMALFPVPAPVLLLFAWANEIVDVGPGDREFLDLLQKGNTSDPTAIAAALGRPPLSLAESLARQPASTGDLWRARLYFLQPMLRLALAALWLGAGLVSMGLFPPTEFYVMLGELGLTGPLAEVALFGAAGANLALGALLVANWRPAGVALAMLALITLFSLAALGLPHEYWLTPFAPILKNAPIAVALLTFVGMQKPRRSARPAAKPAPAPQAALGGARTAHVR